MQAQMSEGGEMHEGQTKVIEKIIKVEDKEKI